jgi:hypothetical protein
LQIVSTPEQSQLWNALVAHYHYLGHCNLPGAQLRYLIYALDFSARYGWRPVLLETFVQEPYPGTGYGAAQWIHLGQTRGRGKKGPHPKDGQTPVPVKHLWVYPLAADFRHALCIQEPWK